MRRNHWLRARDGAGPEPSFGLPWQTEMRWVITERSDRRKPGGAAPCCATRVATLRSGSPTAPLQWGGLHANVGGKKRRMTHAAAKTSGMPTAEQYPMITTAGWLG